MSRYIMVISLLTGISIITPAFAAKTQNKECVRAYSQVKESGELIEPLISQWMQGFRKESISINAEDYALWRKDYFNPRYNILREKYNVGKKVSKNANYELVTRANNFTLAAFQLADYIQVFSRTGDEQSLKNSWSFVNKGFERDIDFIKRRCSVK